MTRYLIIAALVIMGLMLFKRLLPSSKGGSRAVRSPKKPMPDTVVCAECQTEYSPYSTGWICPKCGK